jgi:hypothetical protein
MTGAPSTQQDQASGVLARWRRRIPPGDRDVALIWLASRASMVVVAGAVGWLFVGADGEVTAWVERWARWDFVHFQGIAEFGYSGQPTGVPNEAFFPGLPALLWLGGLVGLPYVVTGLVVSFVAGGVAAVALGRLGDLEGGAGAGRFAVLVWVFAPPAVFLAAPYTESLFLGLAIPAWLAARRGRWAAAGVLTALACTVRVSGLFLVAALIVEWLTSRHRGSWANVGWLLVPAIPVVAWMAYLRWLTGNWLAWLDAQVEEWNRELTWPWDAWTHTWAAAFGGTQTPGFAWMFRAELVAVVIGVVLTAALLWWRRWGEATWVGVQVLAFVTSFWFFSVPRATLLWWPLWIVLAAVVVRRRWMLWFYLAVSVPLMAIWAAAFLTHRWAG